MERWQGRRPDLCTDTVRIRYERPHPGRAVLKRPPTLMRRVTHYDFARLDGEFHWRASCLQAR